jgi:hypothetical protein
LDSLRSKEAALRGQAAAAFQQQQPLEESAYAKLADVTRAAVAELEWVCEDSSRDSSE